MRFSMNPVFTISTILILPELNTTAFGGVATGSINAQDAAKTAEAISVIGERSMELAIAAKIGSIMLAVAVFEVISVKKLTDAITRSSTIKVGTVFN